MEHIPEICEISFQSALGLLQSRTVERSGGRYAGSPPPNLEVSPDDDVGLLRLPGDDLVLDCEDLIDHRRIDVTITNPTALFRVRVGRVEEDLCTDAPQLKHVCPLDDQR